MLIEPPAIDWTRIDLSKIGIAGMTPSRKQRSRDTTAALPRASAELLRRRTNSRSRRLRDAGATVGAFYNRFRSKEVDFNDLLELAARAETRQQPARPMEPIQDAGPLHDRPRAPNPAADHRPRTPSSENPPHRVRLSGRVRNPGQYRAQRSGSASITDAEMAADKGWATPVTTTRPPAS